MDKIFFTGTYTGKDSKGIYSCRFNDETGEMYGLELAAEAVNPSYIAVSNDNLYLYAVSEQQGQSAVSAYGISIDANEIKLSFINEKKFAFSEMCYISISENGQFIAAANYGSGDMAVFSIDSDGGTGDIRGCYKHTGSSINKLRQDTAHAHCSVFDRSGKYILCADLGTDKIYCYRFDRETGVLSKNEAHYETQVLQGCGPRHIIFNSKNDLIYIISELTSYVLLYRFDDSTGELSFMEGVPSLTEALNKSGEVTGADIRLSPNGEFLYVSNRQTTCGRGGDTISVFKTGDKLELTGIFPCGGGTPRNFSVSQNGKYLLCANQSTDSIVCHSIDEKTGALSGIKSMIGISSPVCIQFVR